MPLPVIPPWPLSVFAPAGRGPPVEPRVVPSAWVENSPRPPGHWIAFVDRLTGAPPPASTFSLRYLQDRKGEVLSLSPAISHSLRCCKNKALCGLGVQSSTSISRSRLYAFLKHLRIPILTTRGGRKTLYAIFPSWVHFSRYMLSGKRCQGS
jgi:hypothetical protein